MRNFISRRQREIMSHQPFTLNALPAGRSATIAGLLTKGSMRRRLLDLGFVQGNSIEALYKSPAGDPTAYLVCGTVIALRGEDADSILITF